MKVVLLSSSPKANGNTMQIFAKTAEVIEAEGLEAEVISFAGKHYQSCVACNACKKMGKCVLKDGFNEDILEKVREADGLIIGAPVYFGTARGEMMSVVQRLGMVSYGTDRFLSGMVGGPMAVARRGGLTSTLSEMLMFFFINDMIVPGSDYWNIVFGKQPGEAMEDEEGLRVMDKFAKNVCNLIKKTAE